MTYLNALLARSLFGWLYLVRVHTRLWSLFLTLVLLSGSQVSMASYAFATKDCSSGPCRIVIGYFTLRAPQLITWQAFFTGKTSEPHGFYLTKDCKSNRPDIPLTVSGSPSKGTKFLASGTYYISINLAAMQSGQYQIRYDENLTNDHITKVLGTHYHSLAAGEFVACRESSEFEVQIRKTPIAVRVNAPSEEGPFMGIISAVAARIGRHRVTYEPNMSGDSVRSGMQLRIDGKLFALDEKGIHLDDGGLIIPTNAPGGIRLLSPHGRSVVITPGWWGSQRKWYLHLDLSAVTDATGFLNALDGKSGVSAVSAVDVAGKVRNASTDSFVMVGQTFMNAWRVTDVNTLFDYAPGSSTSSFTGQTASPADSVHGAAGDSPVAAIPIDLARAACAAVRGAENASCVFDVMETGELSFATTYALSQSTSATDPVESCACAELTTDASSGWAWWGLGALILALLLALLFVWRRGRR